MSANIGTILIVGATSGIGEAFAREFHALGKKVIITGRRAERLSTLKQDLPGLDTIQWDVTDISSSEQQVFSILKDHPMLDTVFINSGIQKSFSFLDSGTSSNVNIEAEVTTNITAPIILTRLFLPHLASIAASGKKAHLIITGSGMAFFPSGVYPVYGLTKAAIHSLCLVLRQQISSADANVKRNLDIVELVPTYVDTGLDSEHRDDVNAMQGGADKAFKPVSMAEYIPVTMKQFEETDENGKMMKEIGYGVSQRGIDLWRDSFGKAFADMGNDC